MFSQKPLVPYILFWLGYVVLVALLPVVFPPDATLPNVAARSGYNTGLAYILIATWSVLGMLFFALLPVQREPCQTQVATSISPQNNTGSMPLEPKWLEFGVVLVLVLLLYWPAFLMRHGNYIEDRYFMNVLANMQCGQLPYRDFEFLYGPLMIYPAHYWMKLFGFSMQSYYSFLVFLQASFYIVLLRIFQYHIPKFRHRFIAFLLFVPFVFDTLLGLNYIGWRTMPAIFSIMIVAARPTSMAMSLLAGVLAGMQLAYSYEFGIIALIANILLFSILTLVDRRQPVMLSAFSFVVMAVLVGVLLIVGLTGDTVTDYLSATMHILQIAQDTGIGNLRFYWTLNSLSLFALLSIAIVVLASGFRSAFRNPMSYGDRLLLVATLFTLGSLKVAFQRADIWHMSIAFVPLLLAFLLPAQKQVFMVGRMLKRPVIVLIAIAAITRIIGLLPTASYFGAGLLKGARDVVVGQDSGKIDFESRSYSLQRELSYPDQEIVALAEYLADPVRSERPVVFYGDRWWMGVYVGVCPSGYSFYQLMYTDEYRSIRNFMQQNTGTLVVIGEAAYEYLFENKPVQVSVHNSTVVKKLASWLSSIHYDQKLSDKEIKYESWKRNLGDYLVENYRRTVKIGKNVVLEYR